MRVQGRLDGGLHVLDGIHRGEVEAPSGVERDLSEELALRSAVAFAERVEGVDLAEEEAETVDRGRRKDQRSRVAGEQLRDGVA